MKGLSRRGYGLRLLAVAGLGGLISVVAYLYSAALERRVQVAEFQRLAHVQFRNAQDLLEHSTQLLLAFRGFFMADETVGREEFARFAREVLPSYPEVFALHWAPRVLQDERAAFECDLLPLQERPLGIFDVGADARSPVPAPVRAEYLPIWYGEPAESGRRVIGLDALGHPYAREAASEAARLGVQRATPVFPLVQDPGGPPAVAIFQPVYRQGLPLATDEQRRQALDGQLILILRPSVLLGGLSFDSPALEVRLYDLQDGLPVAIHPPSAALLEPGEGVVHRWLGVPGRQWLIEFVAPRGGGFPVGLQPLLLLLALLALTVVLLLFLDRSCRDAIALERLNGELLRRQKELDGLAYYDALTGLPNRLLLFDRIRMALGLRRRQGGRLAVCVLDLDGFKAVNDRCGHQAGDLLLKEVARRMLAVLRPSDTVARLGGDEFVVVLAGLGDAPTLDGIMRRLIERVSEPVEPGDGQSAMAVSASIGVAFADGDSDAAGLIREADLAMYEAKRAGKACYRVFGGARAADA